MVPGTDCDLFDPLTGRNRCQAPTATSNFDLSNETFGRSERPMYVSVNY
jgi:hypothetical protein